MTLKRHEGIEDKSENHVESVIKEYAFSHAAYNQDKF